MSQRSRRASAAAAASPSKLLFVVAGASSPCSGRSRSASPPGCSTSPPTRRRSPPANRSTRAATRRSTPPTAASSASSPPTRRAPRSRSSAIPKDLQQATVAIEDQRFYEHGGDRRRSRSCAPRSRTSKPGKPVEGGSTITQQLVRNLCIPDPDETSNARSSRRSWPKSTQNATPSSEILGQYLNTASYGTVEGSTAVGVQAASRIYFSRPVWKLDLRRAALLAGLPQAPTDYNPILNPAGARERRDEVLAKMADLGFVSEAEARAAEGEGLGLDVSRSFFTHRQPYFFDYVEDKLIDEYGVNTVRQGGLEVHTTIDPRLQEVGPGSDALGAALLDRPLLGAGLDRPPQRRDQGDGLQLQLRQQPVQPRRAGPPPARLDLQGLRPDHGDQAGHRPLHDLLHLQAARPQPAQVGPLGSPHRRRGLPRHGQPPAGDGRLRQHGLRPARPRRRARSASPRRRSRWGSPARSTGSRPRGSAACGSASRRWRCRMPTRPSPRAGSTTTRSRSSGSSSPAARSTEPETAAPEAGDLRSGRLRGDAGSCTTTSPKGPAPPPTPAAKDRPGKTGTTDGLTDAWFAGYQPNLATAVWVGYPESNEIEMTAVHGISVFGGTFPAEIWHSLYSDGEIPCEDFSQPENPITWAPVHRRVHRLAAGRRLALRRRARARRDAAGPGSGRRL